MGHSKFFQTGIRSVLGKKEPITAYLCKISSLNKQCLRPLQKNFKRLDYPTDVIPAQAGIHAKPSQAID